MLSYRQAMAIGMGQRPDPDLLAAGKDLSWRERRRVVQLTRRGEVAWDVPSARFAAAQAHTVLRQPMLYGKRGTVAAFYVLVLLFIGEAINSVASGPSAQSIFWVGFAIWFVRVAILLPSTIRNAPKAYERNEAYLQAHDPTPRPRAEVVITKRQRILAMVFTGVVLGTLFTLFGYWIDPHGQSAAGRIFGGVFFGVFMVVVQRWAAQRKERQEATDGIAAADEPVTFRKPS